MQYWPSVTGALGERMNSLPKYVVSSTLKDLEWRNCTLIGSDVREEVAALKQGSGGDILLLASADLANSLRADDLIDEYRIWVEPVVHGRGKRYFTDTETLLQLVDTKPLGSGGVVLTYKPRRV